MRVGDTVVVQGSGPVGLNAAVFASLAGALRVLVVDRVAVAATGAGAAAVEKDQSAVTGLPSASSAPSPRTTANVRPPAKARSGVYVS